MFQNHDLNLKTKTAVYRAVILPTLLYGSESWTSYRRHIKQLEQTQQRHLRQIMHIRWFHKVSNAEVLQRASCTTIEPQVTRARLRWSGHILRMQDTRLPRIALYGEFTEGAREPGGQYKRFKDTLHQSLKLVNANHNWEQLALDRPQ